MLKQKTQQAALCFHLFRFPLHTGCKNILQSEPNRMALAPHHNPYRLQPGHPALGHHVAQLKMPTRHFLVHAYRGHSSPKNADPQKPPNHKHTSCLILGKTHPQDSPALLLSPRKRQGSTQVERYLQPLLVLSAFLCSCFEHGILFSGTSVG